MQRPAMVTLLGFDTIVNVSAFLGSSSKPGMSVTVLTCSTKQFYLTTLFLMPLRCEYFEICASSGWSNTKC